MSKNRFRFFVSVLIAGGLAIAMACGGGADPTPTQPAPAATSPPATAKAAPTATPAEAMSGGGQLPDTKSPPGTLVMVPEGGVGAWVGLNRSQAPESLMYWGVSEQLFRPTGEELVTGWLADSWDITPDGSRATVKLRSGVQFHQNNGELTAEDFVWSLNDANAATTPESIHGQAGDFAAFMGPAEALDANTVILNFTAPEPRWTTLLFNQAGDAFGVFSKKLFDANGADWMRENIIGTGPYEVTEAVRDDHITLTAVSNHWDKSGEVQTLRLIDVSETTTRVALLRSGEADWAALPVRDVPDLTEDGFKTTRTGRQNGVPINMAGNYWETTMAKTGEEIKHVTFTHDIPWIGNPHKPDDGNNPAGIDDMEQARLVRQAVAHSIDRDLLNESLYDNNAGQYFIGMFHPIDPNWDSKWSYTYDVAMANQLLDQAGYPVKDGVRFEMPLYAFTSVRDWAELADAVSGFLGEVNIKTNVIKVAYSIVRPSLVARSTTTPATQWCRSDIWLPYDWVRGEEETSLTRGGFGCHMESPFILDVVRKVAAEPDLQKRIEINRTLADYLHHQALKIGVIALPTVAVYNPNAIESWNMRRAPQNNANSPELIVPAR